ncbi:ABC transporter permease [Gryllotalpicola ginsengisoli]|uniref:ABC transporter permease n=1 Tax=Gryllotalpicola ginsengisoli TaxID=444608 RepID=UPI0003B76A41|nr:ABC transporter permease [Gryllotalpicola ginsengisoli]
MAGFLLRRGLFAIGVLVLISIITYGIFFWLSPDPAVTICGKACTPETIATIRHELGLDQPFWLQYVQFVVHFFAGTEYGTGPTATPCTFPCLGFSFQTHQAVWSMISSRLAVSATVAIGAAVLWLLAGIVGGVIGGIKQGTWWDRAGLTVALGSISLPNYFVALILQYLLVVQLRWLPFPSAVKFSDSPTQWFANYLMPWIVLAFGYAAMYLRLVRASVIETLSENFLRTARAKGLPSSLVIRRHALRPALTPVVTMFGMDFAALLGGAVIVETVFGLNGVGKLTSDSITKNDQPVIMGVTLLVAFFVVVANLVVDILYTVLDPRVRIPR